MRFLMTQSGESLPGTRRGGSVFASLPMMSAMPQRRRGLSPRLVRLASPAICFHTAICAPPQDTTIGQEGSRPVEPMHSSSRQGEDGEDPLLRLDDEQPVRGGKAGANGLEICKVRMVAESAQSKPVGMTTSAERLTFFRNTRPRSRHLSAWSAGTRNRDVVRS